MVGGVVRFNGKDITQWYQTWKFGKEPITRCQHDFYTLKEYLKPNMQYFAPSETVETEEQGTIQYYDIVVDGKTLKNGAWICNSKKDWVGFRVSRMGDPANPHVDTFERPEGDGVSVEEDWFG